MRFLFALTLFLSMSVSQADEKTVTVGLIGDSTVAEQSGWGPAFAERFDSRAKILNYAKNGATLQALSKRLDELVELQQVLEECDVIVLLTDHQPFRDLTPEQLAGKTVIDTRGVWRHQQRHNKRAA